MATQQRISFTTFNLFNLNVAGAPIYDEPGWTEQQYAAKLRWTESMLHTARADVFGFQELWARQALLDAFAAARLDDDYTLLTSPSEDGSSIACAGAVRTGLLTGEPRWIVDFPQDFRLTSKGSQRSPGDVSVQIERFSRPVLHLTVRPPGSDPIHVFICHLKSKSPTNISDEDWYVPTKHSRHKEALGSALSTVRRTAEAAALRMVITDIARKDGNGVVVLGDLNDGQLSTTLAIVTGQPRFLVGNTVGDNDTDLYSAQTLQEYRAARDVYYTYIYQDMHQSLDHILVSQELYDNSAKRVWAFDGLDIWNDHLNRRTPGRFSSSGDHAIVRASFKRSPFAGD